MKKKLLALAATAVMSLSTVFSALAEDVECPSWWAAHSSGQEITTEGVEITFDSKTDDAATNNWNTPIYVVYAADAEFKGGAGLSDTAGYTEYFVMRSDNYGWSGDNNTGAAEALETNKGIKVESTGAPTDDAGWAAWLAKNKEGVKCTIKAKKTADDSVQVEFTNDSITSVATIKVDASKKIYVSASGELCNLTNLTASGAKTEEPTDNKKEDDTTDKKDDNKNNSSKPTTTAADKAEEDGVSPVVIVVIIVVVVVVVAGIVVATKKKKND